MKKIFRPQPTFNILSLPVSRLIQADKELNSEFFSKLIKDVPQFGKEAKSHFILNTHLTLENPNNFRFVSVLNVFLHIAARNHHLIQLTK